MNFSATRALLADRIDAFNPESYQYERFAAMYSAAVAGGDETILSVIVQKAQEFGIEYGYLYEIVLQSYLFLGFPRMLISAEHLARAYNYKRESQSELPLTCEQVDSWMTEGRALCQRIYKDNFDTLRTKVLSIAPEIFQWMLLEGYGKVLSRDGMDMSTRELSIVGFLMMEHRPRQLHSHMLGALHVEIPRDLIKLVINDIGEAAGEGYTSAQNLCKQLNI